MKRWLMLGYLALISGTAPAEDPATLDPATGAGLAGIETLWKAGEMRVDMSSRFGVTNLAYAYEMAFQAPDRMALRKQGSLVISDGTNLTVQAEYRDLVRYATVPLTNRFQARPFLAHEPDPLILDLAALLEPDPPNALLNQLRKLNATPAGEEALDGKPCRVVDLELVRQGDFVMRARLWVDKQWGVIRKMTSRWETPSGTNAPARRPDMTMEFVLTDLRVNQPLSPVAFDHTPHPKARRMASPERLFMFPHREEQNASLGEPAPDFTLPLLDGATFRLSDHTGKVVVIDFWATWCGPCVRALPEMKKLSEQFADQDVVLVGVSSDQARAEPKVRELVASNGLTYAIGIATNDIGEAYGVTGIPCLFVVDRQGRIQHRHVGYDPTLSDKIGAVVEKTLAGQTAEAPRPWTEEEKAALAEEEEIFSARRALPAPPDPDTNAFRKVWRGEPQPESFAPPGRLLATAIAPATYTLLDGATLLVVDAVQGRIRHRLDLPPDLVERNLMGQSPRHLFLSAPDGGVAVFLHVQYAYHDDGVHNHYQSTGAVLRAISADGTRRWSREVPSDSRALEALPGPDGRERLLLLSWNDALVLDADGQERWRQRLFPAQLSHIEAGAELGAWDLLTGGNNAGRFRWLDPPPRVDEPEEAP